MANEDIKADKDLVAMCGLYCGACGKYLKGRCPGCTDNEKASWCKVRACCIENEYKTCAECKTYDDFKDCKNLNNFMAKFFALFFNSNRPACLREIKKNGRKKFADEMARTGKMTLPRK